MSAQSLPEIDQMFHSAELAQRTLYRRAVETVIWSIPLVNYDAMNQALLRDAKGGANQVAYWSRPSTWKNQTLTSNGETLYIFVFIDTSQMGPMVLEIPPAGDAAFFGTVIDSWNAPIEDVGPAGLDKGNGARYLVLPPNYRDALPDGYTPLHSKTFQSYAALRTIPKSWAEEDLVKSAAYLRQVKLYPLSKVADPPATRFIDVADSVFDATIAYDLRYFHALDRMVQVEPFQAKDKMMISWLQSIGIEKGKSFAPGPKIVDVLTSAVKEARAWLEDRFLTVLQPFFPGSRWLQPFEAISASTHSTFETPDLYATDSRAIGFSFTHGAPRRVGGGAFYLIAQCDKAGQALSGENTYRLNVPLRVPANQFWSVAVNDMSTAAFIRESPRVSLSSFVQGLQRNGDGSVDIYFSPSSPAGMNSNWIPTESARRFFVVFRFYGPEKELFHKTWQLPDIERI